MPCSAPTAPSQAALVGVGAGYYVRNSTRTGRARVGVPLGLGLHLGSETISGSEMGSAHTRGAYAYGYSQRRRTNVHTPNGAVGRVLPPLAAVPTFSPPTLQLSRGCGRVKSFIRKCTPFCICIRFCFCIPIEDGSGRLHQHEYGVVYRLWRVVFHGRTDQYRCWRRRRGVSSLLYLDPALSRSCRNTPPNHNHDQPKTDLQTHIGPYFLLILQHERLQHTTAAACVGAACWVWVECCYRYG